MTDIQVSLPHKELLIHDGDFLLTKDEDSEIQNICTQFLCDNGELFYDLSFGMSILKFIHSNSIGKLQSDMAYTLRKDPRILSSSVNVNINKVLEGIMIELSIQLVNSNKTKYVSFQLNDTLP